MLYPQCHSNKSSITAIISLWKCRWATECLVTRFVAISLQLLFLTMQETEAIIPHHNWLIWTKNVALLSLLNEIYTVWHYQPKSPYTVTVTALLDKIIQGCYSNHLDICTLVCTSIQLWNITISSACFHINAQAALASPRSVQDGTHVSRCPFHYQPCRVGSGTHRCSPKLNAKRKLKQEVFF